MTTPATTAPATRMLTPAQVGRLTNLSRAAVYRAIERGELRASRLCGRLRVDPEELEAWKHRNLVTTSKGSAPAPLLTGRTTGPSSSSFLDDLERMGPRRG